MSTVLKVVCLSSKDETKFKVGCRYRLTLVFGDLYVDTYQQAPYFVDTNDDGETFSDIDELFIFKF